MSYFAIQHKPTGAFLPEPPGKLRSRGYTYHEPTKDFPPRLFRDAKSAKIALTYWLKGVHSVSPSYDYESGGIDGEDFHLDPKPERKQEEMAVVVVELVVQ